MSYKDLKEFLEKERFLKFDDKSMNLEELNKYFEEKQKEIDRLNNIINELENGIDDILAIIQKRANRFIAGTSKYNLSDLSISEIENNLIKLKKIKGEKQ